MSRTKPIPSDAKRVFKGVIFDVYQWEQRLYDGTTTTFEKLKRSGTVDIIPTTGNDVILVDEEQPNYAKRVLSFPAGRMEEGEDPLAAAKRELLEETGYVSDEWELFSEDQPVSKIDWTVYTYIAKNCRFLQEPDLDAGEKMETRLFAFDDFLKLTELPEHGNLRNGRLAEFLQRARYLPEGKEELKKMLF